MTASPTFKASSTGHTPGECIIILEDNDMPTLGLTLTPAQVSESAGASAVIGTIHRTDNLDKEVVLRLSEDSGGRLSCPRSVTMAAGQEEVQFNISTIDNSMVDGNKTVTITAEVYAASCSCSIPPENDGTMTKTLVVMDDDGPSLTISSSARTLLEGSTGNVFTVSHNMASSEAVTVRVSSDKDDMLDYEHSVTIAAGSKSAQFLVDVKRNSTTGDSQLAAFTVENDGFSSASMWIVVTDQTLPDAVVSLTTSVTEVEAEGTLQTTVVVANNGYQTLPVSTLVNIWFSGSSYPASLKTDKALEPGETTSLTYDYVMPASTGNYTLHATVNDDRNVQEVVYANNSSQKQSIRLLPKFSVTAQADKDVYVHGENIVISGQAQGSAGKNALVEVYLINEGSRQKILVKSDGDGKFSLKWPLQERQSGHFVIGACYPGSGENSGNDTFDVYGIRTDNYFVTCVVDVGDTYTGKIRVTNPGNLVQSGLRIEPQSTPDNVTATFSSVSSIAAGAAVELDFSIQGNAITSGTDWQQIPVVVKTDEGATANFILYYYVQSLHAQLTSNTKRFSTTMTFGKPREYPITVRNIGKGETGNITLSLPDWMSSTSSYNIPSLSKGDSTTIVLQFVPNNQMKLNVPVTGQLGVNCANGDGLAIAFDITPVSEETGTLTVDVMDESTFYTEEKPHLAGARVTVKTPVAGTVVAQGITSADGKYTVSLPEGWYNIHVEADKHSSYDNSLIVDPGVSTNHDVFLTYQAITYTWEVEETEVEDVYEIETVATYDTRVPKPVVLVYLPDETPEPYGVLPIVVTNEGLIDAAELNLSLTIDEGYYFEFLNTPALDVLKAHQSYTFYAKMLPLPDESQNAKRRAMDFSVTKKCFTIISRAKYKELCEQFVGEQMAQAIKRYGYEQCVYNIQTGSSSGEGGGFNDNNEGGFGYHGDGGYNGGSTGPGIPIPGGSNQNSDSYYKIYDTESATKHCGPLYPDLDTLPDGQVPETENCVDFPILDYSLVTTDKKREIVKGLAADGASKVRIALDPTTSRIPSRDCSQYKIKWRLSKELGKLKQTELWDDIVYEAPENLPEDFELPADTVFAIYKVTGDFEFEDSVKIVVSRTPLLLLHGLVSNSDCWKKFVDRIVSSQLYDINGLDNIGYEASNCDKLEDNEMVVQNRLDFLFEKMKHKMGIIAKKADIVGHSMGGLLARAHAEHVTTENIHKIITVNTPHSGSEIADLVENEGGKLKDGIVDIAQLFEIGGFYSTDAAYDLGVNSSAIDSYLNAPENLENAKGVPVHAIATEYFTHMGDEEVEACWNSVEAFLNSAGDPSEYSVSDKFIMFSLMLDYSYASLFQEKIASDFVVTVESQRGGLADDYVDLIQGTWHCASPRNTEVQNCLIHALKVPADDAIFSTDGFNPVDRLYLPSVPLPDIELDEISIKTVESGQVLEIQLEGIEKYAVTRIAAIFDDGDFNISTSGLLQINLPSSYKGTIHVIAGGLEILKDVADANSQLPSSGELLDKDELSALMRNANIAASRAGANEGRSANRAIRLAQDELLRERVKEFTIEIPEAKSHPVRLVGDEMALLVGDTLRTRVKCIYDDGTESYIKPDAIRAEKGFVKVNGRNIVATKAGHETLRVTYENLGCNIPVEIYKSSDDDEDSGESESICSTITLSFKQKMVMTRQAFRGTLTVNNGNETGAMENVTLDLQVRDSLGNVMTSHEFQINMESLDGFAGELDFTSGWRLSAAGTGTATILFIPTRYAAPTETTDYSFGGTLSYKDPTTGLQVTRELNPVTLTVNPSPTLDLDYFLQRDVFADDPLTDEVEATQPAEFALLINNKGYGDATKVRMTTNQPEIVDNEKGLIIDFEILSTQVNGSDSHLSFGKNAVNDFGTIAARSQSYAQWWLGSSVLGHFTSYDVSATHVTSYGNEDLSLLDKVSIHELIHGFTVEDGRGFLVNDIPDKANQPDQVYLTDASEHDVIVPSSITMTGNSKVEYVLSVSVSQPSWTYGSLPDPTNGRQDVLSIVRMSDGKELPLDNIWQTDRTLRKGADPLYENLIHFVGEVINPTETYLVTFEAKPDTVLEVSSFTGVPDAGVLSPVALAEVHVLFNKPIQQESFTVDDLSLSCQGAPLDASKMSITRVSDMEYAINVSELTSQDGYYVLTVMTTDITDNEGFHGDKGFNASWTQLDTGMATLSYETSPEGVGSLTIKLFTSDGNQAGDSINTNDAGAKKIPLGYTAQLTAHAQKGYTFAYWTRGGEKVSTDSIYEFVVTWNEEVKAHYQINSYEVTINNNNLKGRVAGATSGTYYYGTELHLTVETEGPNRLMKWVINDTEEVTTLDLTITVEEDLKIETVYSLLGDFDYDGTNSITDVSKLVNHILGTQELENINNADMDGDGAITIDDLQKLVEVILKGF